MDMSNFIKKQKRGNVILVLSGFLESCSPFLNKETSDAITEVFQCYQNLEPRILSTADIRNLCDYDRTKHWDVETPLWIEGRDEDGYPVNGWRALEVIVWNEENKHHIPADRFGGEIADSLDIDMYRRTWVAWNRKPPDDMLGDNLIGDEE